jgi:hypothetical protein
MRIVKHLLCAVFALFVLFVLTRTLVHPHKDHYDSPDTFLFSKGNAPEDVRTEITGLLNEFQDGYTRRDTSRIKPFMERLFSDKNVLILGTMPHEICIGREEATRLVFADWYRWGDCTFLTDNAHISSYGDVAWISTIGYVKFDLSGLLVLPLRLSAVAAKEHDVWKFQQMQFQFDLDLTFLLVGIVLVAVWLAINAVKLVVVIVLTARKHRNIQGQVER